jgi:hypothetical protein
MVNSASHHLILSSSQSEKLCGANTNLDFGIAVKKTIVSEKYPEKSAEVLISG